MNKVKKILTSLRFIRFRPFDCSSAQGREDERQRRIAISFIASLIGQVINYAVMFIMVPVLIGYMGKEKYGLWLTINSMLAYSQFADLGLGNGLVNLLSENHGMGERDKAREYVSSAVVMLGIVGVIGFVVFWLFARNVNWIELFQVKSNISAGDCSAIILATAFLFFLNLPVSIVRKIQMAYQENYLNSLWMAFGKISVMIGVVLGVSANKSFFFMILVLSGIPVVFTGLNLLYLLYVHKTWLSPRVTCVRWDTLCELTRTGSLFFIAGISTLLATQIDILVIAHYLGAESVPTYALPLRLFMLCTTVLGFILLPLWPAYRHAIVQGDYQWVKKTFWRTLMLTFSATFPFVLILFFFVQYLVSIWANVNIDIPRSLVASLCILALMRALNFPMNMLQNGANILKLRAASEFVGAFVNVFISIFLIQRIGISGPIWGTVICQLLFSWTVSIYCIRKLFLSKAMAS